MDRADGEKPEQAEASRARDLITLPGPRSPEETVRLFAESAAEVDADNEQRPRRNLDPVDEAEDEEAEEQRDKWDDPETTSARIEELKNEGHGPQRHVEITDAGIDDRLGTASHDQYGAVEYRNDGHVKKQRGSQIDPATGTSTDAGTGGFHYCGPYATRFNDPADYCRAEEKLRQRAVQTGDLLQEESISVLFPGPDDPLRFTGRYQDRARPENPDGSARLKAVDFTNGTIIARYDEDDSGDITLTTMFPEPDPSRNA